MVPFRLNKNNFESQMAINYYSHCLIIAKLLPLMRNRPQNERSEYGQRENHQFRKSRIVMVTSAAHHGVHGLRLDDLNSQHFYSPSQAYCQSKLAQVMFCYQFNRWLQSFESKQSMKKIHPLDDDDDDGETLSKKITINCLHPGLCRTGLMDAFNFTAINIHQTPFFRSAIEGAECILHATLSPRLESKSGFYYEDCLPTKSSHWSYDETLQKRLWTTTWKDLKPWLTKEEFDAFVSDE
ncbi:hypothetical protein QR98_0001910 [Sarcoptes scabiei]|uniref:Uncharacterized protein n=1 Tax=Sarcoptes scabiei TaxID=52283 RepID=A0A131ZTB8_SARSC|nr:hypothetical protein QR98_0001910 [Sarcoptes scabiei]